MFEKYKDVVSVDDLCNMLDIGKNSAYKLLQNKQIKSIRIGKVYKIPKRYVLDYLNIA